jgi:hypothetical protein
LKLLFRICQSPVYPPVHLLRQLYTSQLRADVEAVEDGKKVFFVFGEIQYRDAFDRERFTKFRFHHNNTASGDTLLVSEVGNEET